MCNYRLVAKYWRILLAGLVDSSRPSRSLGMLEKWAGFKGWHQGLLGKVLLSGSDPFASPNMPDRYLLACIPNHSKGQHMTTLAFTCTVLHVRVLFTSIWSQKKAAVCSRSPMSFKWFHCSIPCWNTMKSPSNPTSIKSSEIGDSQVNYSIKIIYNSHKSS